MAGRGAGPDFVEALARGLDILAGFDAAHRTMSLSEVATTADLARPTARRLLLTLQEMGYVRSVDGGFELTPKVIGLGMSYVSSLGLWDIARPHLEALVRRTGESSSMAQLDGSDIVYVARVSVPKIIALRVEIGTRFPAAQTSQGKVLMADLSAEQLEVILAEPSRSGLPPYIGSSHDQLLAELTAGPGPWLGPGRRGARSGCPVGGRAGPGRYRSGPRGDERYGACRGDVHGGPAREPSAEAATDSRRRQRRVGAVAVPPAHRGRGRLLDCVTMPSRDRLGTSTRAPPRSSLMLARRRSHSVPMASSRRAVALSCDPITRYCTSRPTRTGSTRPTACSTTRCLAIAWRVTGRRPAREDAEASPSPSASRMRPAGLVPSAANTGTNVPGVTSRSREGRPACPARRPSPRGGSRGSRPGPRWSRTRSPPP